MENLICFLGICLDLPGYIEHQYLPISVKSEVLYVFPADHVDLTENDSIECKILVVKQSLSVGGILVNTHAQQ